MASMNRDTSDRPHHSTPTPTGRVEGTYFHTLPDISPRVWVHTSMVGADACIPNQSPWTWGHDPRAADGRHEAELARRQLRDHGCRLA